MESLAFAEASSPPDVASDGNPFRRSTAGGRVCGIVARVVLHAQLLSAASHPGNRAGSGAAGPATVLGVVPQFWLRREWRRLPRARFSLLHRNGGVAAGVTREARSILKLSRLHRKAAILAGNG